MKPKKEYIILVIIIAALLVYLSLKKTNRMNYQLPKISEVKQKSISRFEINKGGESIVLNKKDNTWYIGTKGYPADPGKVKNMLDVIGKLRPTTLVSEGKGYVRYDLGDDKKIGVKAWADNTICRSFDIGKAAQTYQHTFVKLTGDPNIYQASGVFRGKFDQTVEELRDKTVLAFEQKDISGLYITKGKKSFVFHRRQPPVEVKAGKTTGTKETATSKKEETGWQTADGKEVDVAKLNRLLSTLSKLSCQKYVDDRTKADFKNPICKIGIKGSKEHTLSIFAKKDKEARDFPAISSENDYPFFLGKWQVDQIMKDPNEMIKRPEKS